MLVQNMRTDAVQVNGSGNPDFRHLVVFASDNSSPTRKVALYDGAVKSEELLHRWAEAAAAGSLVTPKPSSVKGRSPA
jgi:hypothetical protein